MIILNEILFFQWLLCNILILFYYFYLCVNFKLRFIIKRKVERYVKGYFVFYSFENNEKRAIKVQYKLISPISNNKS